VRHRPRSITSNRNPEQPRMVFETVGAGRNLPPRSAEPWRAPADPLVPTRLGPNTYQIRGRRATAGRAFTTGRAPRRIPALIEDIDDDTPPSRSRYHRETCNAEEPDARSRTKAADVRPDGPRATATVIRQGSPTRSGARTRATWRTGLRLADATAGDPRAGVLCARTKACPTALRADEGLRTRRKRPSAGRAGRSR